MPFISVCLITLARTASKMLNKSDKRNITCLAPDYKGKAFSLSPLYVRLRLRF